MNTQSFTYASLAVIAAIVISVSMSLAIIEEMKPGYAQSTDDSPSIPSTAPDTDSPTETGSADNDENFQQFMQCLFGGEASEEDISSALDGTGDSTPTEQEIRDCFAPLYNTGEGTTDTTTDTTTTADTGSADADDSSPEEDGDSGTDSEAADDPE
jgi:hypothetical protein